MKALVGAFNEEKALVGAFSVIMKTGCGTDGALHSTNHYTVLVTWYLVLLRDVGAAVDPAVVHRHLGVDTLELAAATQNIYKQFLKVSE